jgi:YHS domain-containing protein
MVRWMTSAAALTMALNLMGPAVAKSAKKAVAKTPACPVCKMALSPKKTKANTVAVPVNGKTYYCCAKCDMSKLGHSKGTAAKKAS